ncbi:MAG: DUF1385 domain-containing protein [Armatimonadota bacterium]
MADRSAYGGQAVIEGVMIRGKERVTTAVRLKDGSIIERREVADALLMRHKWLRLAFLRGTPALVDSLRLGYRTLTWSADLTMESEGQEKPSPLVMTLTVILAFGIGIGLFVLLPSAMVKPPDWLLQHLPAWWPHFTHPAAGHATGFWQQFIPTSATFLPNVIEGVIRILMLVGYILLIGRMADIKRVFAYHGAEHKVVNAYEAGAELTVDGARGYSRIHPRCGTSFLFLVFVVGILIHALIGFPDNTALRLLSRLVLLLPIAGIAYELIRLAGRFRGSWLLRVLVFPGMLLQRLTTAEPDDSQVEVALQALRGVLEDEGVLAPQPKEEPVAETAPATS